MEIWWYSSQPVSIGAGGASEHDVTFDSRYLSSTVSVVRVSNLQASRRVVAVDPERSRVVLADAFGDQRNEDSETQLYLADAKGNGQRALQMVAGEVEQAWVSSDGSWLLFIAQRNKASIEEIGMGRAACRSLQLD